MTKRHHHRDREAIVVGAGIVGIACAHYLAQDGWTVTVIDRGRLARACSHANCGYVCPSHVLPLTEPQAMRMALRSLFQPNAPFRVRPRLSPALWRWLWEFAKRCHERQMLTAGRHLKSLLDSSMQAYRQLMREEPLECQWRESGLLYVLQTEAGLEDFSSTDRFLKKHFGLKAEQIDRRHVSEFEPALQSNLAGAFYYDGDASLRPDQLNDAWVRRLRDQNVRFVESCELQTVRHRHERVQELHTSEGIFKADVIVYAMGAWSSQLQQQIGCSIPIQPGKGYSVTTNNPKSNPKYPMLFPEHKVGVSPFADGFRLGSMMEFVGFDTTIPSSRIEQLYSSAIPYLKTQPPKQPSQAWFGWRPMTWDSLPIIGPVPGSSNSFLATGHNMLGLSLATGTGQLIAELVDQRPTHIDATPFSPARFQ